MRMSFAARQRSAEQHVSEAGAALARHDCRAALRHFREALALSRRLMIADPANDQHVYRAARCELDIGRVLEIQGYPEAGAAHLEASLNLLAQGPQKTQGPPTGRALATLPVPVERAQTRELPLPGTWRVFVLRESGADVAIELAERLTCLADGLDAYGALARGRNSSFEGAGHRERLALAGTARHAALEQALCALDTLCALINVSRPFPDLALRTRWQGQESARARRRRRQRKRRAARSPS